MKGNRDVARGWLQKAEGDLTVVDLSLPAGAHDAACFHAQQAAEKCLKAFLIYMDVDFPFTHDLPRLLELCEQSDKSFGTLAVRAEILTPYAVELRYDTEFWATQEDAEQARVAALEVRDFVLSRLPKDVQPQ